VNFYLIMADVENSNGASNKVEPEPSKTKVEISDKDKKGIVRQIEHYFGDFNLPKDKFLLEQTKINDGWVSMETMLKFKRLAALCDDAATICDILATANGLMEVDAAGSRIRRAPSKPVPEWNDERRAQLVKQTVYVKGFDKENTTLDGLVEFFEEKLGSDVLNLQMRNYQDKKDKNKKGFKGSLFVTFKDRESAEKFLALEEFLVVGANGAEAKSESMWQEDYNAMKQKEWEDNKLKKKQDKNKLQKAKQGGGDDKADDKVKTDAKEGESEEKEEGLPKGSVLVFSGLNGETTREDLKEKLNSAFSVDTADIAFVYYQKGEDTAKLRFKTEGAAVAVAEKIEGGKLEVKGAETSVKALEGEEEEVFLKECSADIGAHMAKKKGGRFGGHKRRGGGRGGGPGAKRGRR